MDRWISRGLLQQVKGTVKFVARSVEDREVIVGAGDRFGRCAHAECVPTLQVMERRLKVLFLKLTKPEHGEGGAVGWIDGGELAEVFGCLGNITGGIGQGSGAHETVAPVGIER